MASTENATMNADACKTQCLDWGFAYTIVVSNLQDSEDGDADDMECWCGNSLESLYDAEPPVYGVLNVTDTTLYSYEDRSSPVAVNQDYPAYTGQWVAAGYGNADWTVTLTRGFKGSTESVTKDSMKTRIDNKFGLSGKFGYLSDSGKSVGGIFGLSAGWGRSDETSRESSEILTNKEEYSATWNQDMDSYGGQAMLWRWQDVIDGYPGYGVTLTARMATTRSAWEPPCCEPVSTLAYRDWRLGCPPDLIVRDPETLEPRYNCWPYLLEGYNYTRYEAACYWEGFDKTPPGAMVLQLNTRYFDDCLNDCTAKGKKCAGFQFGVLPYEITPQCYHLKAGACGACSTMYENPAPTTKEYYRVGAPSWAVTHLKIGFDGCPDSADVAIEEGPGYKEIVWR